MTRLRAFAPVLTAMPAAGIPLGFGILGDSGYAHRDVGRPGASRSRPGRGAAGSRTCTRTKDGKKAPSKGAVISNGNLDRPQAPRALLDLGPLARTATKEQTADHDRKTAELARHKLGSITADDADGCHRVQCPTAMGKIRCPLRPSSMTLDRDRPEILQPPEHPQACCAQQTITVPPGALAKTAQKHDYPSQAHRRPTPAAPAPSAASPPSRTPPPATSPAAGAASRAWRP